MSDLNDQLTQTPPPDPRKITSPGATTPAASVLSIKDQLRANTTTTPTQPRRGPGRPPKTPATPTTKTPEELAAEKLAAKRQRATELKGKLAGEYNDYLLEFIVAQVPALTPSAIWLAGKEPKHDTDGKYTDIGSALAINEFMATSLGHFAAELEYSGVGQSVSGAVSGGPLGMILWGLLSLASVGMYAKGLKDMMDRLAMIQNAQQRMQEQARTQREGTLA